VSLGRISDETVNVLPARRTRPEAIGAPAANSFSPRRSVDAAIPVIRETAAIPPWPAWRASVAANNRRAPLIQMRRQRFVAFPNQSIVDHARQIRTSSQQRNPDERKSIR
jgi:hypothetical protein